jgi:hypothetical protein
MDATVSLSPADFHQAGFSFAIFSARALRVERRGKNRRFSCRRSAK